MRRVIFLFVPLFLFSQTGYVLKTGTFSHGGGFSYSTSYRIKGVAGITANGTSRSHDYTIQSGLPYLSIIIGVDEGTVPTIPEVFHFFPLTPNPMTDRAMISFTLPEKSLVKISIYDISGREIWKVEKVYSAGENRIYWYGKDRRGGSVGNGVYILRFEGLGHVIKKKILLVR